MFDFTYIPQVIFAVTRIAFWFLLLFGGIAPLFLDHTRKLPPIERLIYSWTGLGGVIIFAVFILTTLHIYDFISFLTTMLCIPLIRYLWLNRGEGIVHLLKNAEYRTLLSHLRFLERKGTGQKAELKNKVREGLAPEEGHRVTGQTILAILIALVGGIIRIIPAVTNAAPFNRTWYRHLERIKNLRLEQYFTDGADPAGMHSLVSVFSMLTQVSPEMMLHILGALSSFFLCIIIFWVTKDLSKNRYPMAPIFAMSIYAFVPMLLLPISLEQQIEANTLDLALCFAFPTITIFIRNLRSTYKSPWFYVLSGFLATGFINLFVALVILLPAMCIGLLALPRRKYLRSLGRVLGYLASITLLILLPFGVVTYINNTDFLLFLRGQIFDTAVYSFNPLLIADLGILSELYTAVAVGLVVILLTDRMVRGKWEFQDELIFLLVFIGVGTFYLPYIQYGFIWVDADQLNPFYAMMIAIVAGIMFHHLLRFIQVLFRSRDRWVRVGEKVILIFAISGLIYLQGGIHISRVLPSTLPNGFFRAYYDLIDEHLPYSYATVGPEIDRNLARNRHYFMNYEFFLEQYGHIDSLYHQQLTTNNPEVGPSVVPPASIFVFVEKPPYGSIQQGIVYDSKLMMSDLEQWLQLYRNREGRRLDIYYQNQEVTVYEIVNRPDDSQVNQILTQTRPQGES